MKRIAVLTAGGDTPALNATLHGLVTRANAIEVDVIGIFNGFQGLFLSSAPHVRLNPNYVTIPELDPARGGSIIGASRHYVHPEDRELLLQVRRTIDRLSLDGLVCVGGDGTLNGLQPLCELLPCVLAPKTIDNDLGLNMQGEARRWERSDPDRADSIHFRQRPHADVEPLDLEGIVNYVTPGYATAVFVAAGGVARVRTTAESHRRVAIIEVMGRHSGYIALGAAYGQPDIILIPEFQLDMELLAARVEEVYRHQQNVVIVCGEGIVDPSGSEYGARSESTDPAGNLLLSGAAERLKTLLVTMLGDTLFVDIGGHHDADAAIFTRKVGHTQRGGHPLLFDRYHASQLGANALDLLCSGLSNHVSTIQWSAVDGFSLDGHSADIFRDDWGVIHARRVDPSFYDPSMLQLSVHGGSYLKNIFTGSIGAEDVDFLRNSLFDSGNLDEPFASITVAMRRRLQQLDD
jgi:6-phosphofructokinase 1